MIDPTFAAYYALNGFTPFATGEPPIFSRFDAVRLDVQRGFGGVMLRTKRLVVRMRRRGEHDYWDTQNNCAVPLGELEAWIAERWPLEVRVEGAWLQARNIVDDGGEEAPWTTITNAEGLIEVRIRKKSASLCYIHYTRNGTSRMRMLVFVGRSPVVVGPEIRGVEQKSRK